MSALAPPRFRFRRSRVWAALALAWLAAGMAGAYGLGETARRNAAAELARQSENAAALHAAVLRSELEKYRALPPAMATDADVARLLRQPGDDVDVEPLNRRLEALAGQTRASAIYVIGADGVTRAASNWRETTSFVGSNYGFRPYFIQAMRDGAAEFFALGTVSGEPGLFLAQRVSDAGGKALGVVVVKVEFDALEAEWRASGEPAYVVDPGGVVLITSVPAWRFRTLRAMDATSRRLTLADQTLGHGALTPLPFSTPATKGSLVLAPVDGKTLDWMHTSAETATPGWTLHLLTPTRGTIEAAVANARVMAILIITLTFGLLAVFLRRRQQTAARQRAAEARRRDLEQRIAERTHDLRQANLALNRQIQERMRAEASREAMRDDLVQAGKLAALGQIAAGVAHEINQPVAAIRTYAETATAYLERDQNAKAVRALGRIGDLTARIAAITQELRAFSRKSEPRLETVSLNAAIDGALLLLAGRLRQAGVHLVHDRMVDALVIADRFRLEQVIVNLMQNAIETLEDTAAPVITLSVRLEEGRVKLIVADNGPGVPEAIQSQLFTPFVTSKANGLGLGLVICRDIVTAFGGELNLHPSDHGAVFVVALRSA